MKISIITSCFNREATIGQAIESVLSQDYPDIEYIVVDGASKDRSLEVINRYKDRISKIISEPDKGMYEGINKGIKAATGDIIGLLHSDDFLYAKDTISRMAQEFERTGADFVYGNGLFVDPDNTDKVIRNWMGGSYSKWKVRHGWLPLHPTCYIRKECYDRYGLYDESYKIAADSDLLVRFLYEADLKVEYLNNTSYVCAWEVYRPTVHDEKKCGTRMSECTGATASLLHSPNCKKWPGRYRNLFRPN